MRADPARSRLDVAVRPPRIALTREVSPAIERCELTHVSRVAIDVEIARAQHRQYERCLEELGCMVQRLDADPDLPDSVFVEDVAVVFDELALITRPGAESRRPEAVAVAETLRRYRTIRRIEPPGTLDGGDVLQIGRRVFVGCSSRTNPAGIRQMRALLGAYGYTVQEVAVRGCLHLKTAATAVADDLLLVNHQWVPVGGGEFSGLDILDVHPAEPFGANALQVGECVIYPAACPRTRERLEQRGVRVCTLEMGELAKAEGGVTCCSLIFRA
jgi:dimethylargininase